MVATPIAPANSEVLPVSLKNTEEVVKAYLAQGVDKTLLRDVFASYNDFADVKINDIMKGFNPIKIHTGFDQPTMQHAAIYEVSMVNPRILPPSYMDRSGARVVLTPEIARTRNFAYSGQLVVDISIIVKHKDYAVDYTETLEGIEFGYIPILVRSNKCRLSCRGLARSEPECPFDEGGYFLINGSEKVIINQERISENTIFVYKDNKSTSHDFCAEVRSVSSEIFSPPKMTSVVISKKKNKLGKTITLTNLHYIKCADIPLFVMFRALGIVSDREIIEYVLGDTSLDTATGDALAQALVGSAYQAHGITTQYAARDFLRRHLSKNNQLPELMASEVYRVEYLERVLEHDFLPHIGKDLQRKALYLGMVVKALLMTSFGIRRPDDRDSYTMKRVETAGALLASLFRQHYAKLVKDFKKNVEKELKNLEKKPLDDSIKCINRFSIRRLIRSKTLDVGMKYALSTGTWGSNLTSKKARLGVSQILSRLNYPATLSHFRRVSTPIEKSGKVIKPRQLHCSQYGIICASESPEGAPIGLLKNLALSASVTVKTSTVDIESGVLDHLKIERDVSPAMIRGKVLVMVNSKPCGCTAEPQVVFAKLKALKHQGIIASDISIAWLVLENEIRVCSDAGRVVRPLFRVVDGRPVITSELINAVAAKKISWEQLIYPARFPDLAHDACVEIMDVQEVVTSLVARTVADLVNNPHMKYQYMEIHPALIFGVIAANMSFANHNQTPRITYCSAMMKQAIGVYHSKWRQRYDTVAHVLTYAQRPLTQSAFSNVLKVNDLPFGNNIIVAFGIFTGYNQEDSLIINKSSVERGMFHSTMYKTYTNSIDTSSRKEDVREEYGIKHLEGKKAIVYGGENKTLATGFPAKDSYVKSNDILFGKYSIQTHPNGEETYTDTSERLKHNEEGFVDRVACSDSYFSNNNCEGNDFAEIKTRVHREVVNGDKLAHGAQKGTIGMAVAQADMPHTAEGLVPDIIVNPNAMPGRMTVGMVVDMALGRHCAVVGKFGSTTPFTSNITMDELKDALRTGGCDQSCEEKMYCPSTGRAFKGTMYIGMAYYEKLKHMVADKVHSRGVAGPTLTLTRQSVSGRSKLGATRCGNMETASLTGMGTRCFLKERMVESADNYIVYICARCGSNEVVMIHGEGRDICQVCKSKASVKEVRMPYCAKLLMQEMQGMGINTKTTVGGV